MIDKLQHFDDLPKRDSNHVTQDSAETAFQGCLDASGRFILQRSDRKDYGTDCLIEAIDQQQATNVRVHVQLKGTSRSLNGNGSLSIEVRRSNLNYLLMHPHSFYAAYHLPTKSLRICLAENVVRQYEHSGKNWSRQNWLTVSFADELTVERLDRLSGLAISSARAARDRRIAQTVPVPQKVALNLQHDASDLYVPEDPAMAADLLTALYHQSADSAISAAFDKFLAVLGVDHKAMGLAYMAEINLGMAGMSQKPKRIESAVAYFRAHLDSGRYERGSLQYTIGNAFSALGREEDAKPHFEGALAEPTFATRRDLASQAHQNLGTSLERLGYDTQAVNHYREALSLDPDLPEAHYAVAQFYVRKGEWEHALWHLDQAVFTHPAPIRMAGVAGWRSNVLFNMGKGSEAFREINGLLGLADSWPWIWPFFSKLIATFGRTTTKNAQLALPFWRRYITAHPEDSIGHRELLLAIFYLRSNGCDAGKTYEGIQSELETRIQYIHDNDEAALLWDRLGHWAQDEDNWPEAERCFRNAHRLVSGQYGYCLGTALNFLGRHEESLPILREQAERIQPDAMSWFQLGVACNGLGHSDSAIDAYETALSLDPEYDLAMFNLGGVYWNIGQTTEALGIWAAAIKRFPDHELATKLRHDVPELLSNENL